MFQSIWLWLKKLTFIFWLLFMLLLGVRLAMDNGAMVSVSIFNLNFPETSLGLVICVSLLIGAILGFFTNYLVLKPGLVAKRRALNKANKEVANLRMQRNSVNSATGRSETT